MRICLVGKYPPIAGGVSMRCFRFAHALAERGHEIHVVTNADEVGPPYRMFMHDEDWGRCEADYGKGSVHVHWTAPPDRSQFAIPMASAHATKLAGLGIDAVERHAIDIVFSFYVEPYAVAGHLIAEACGLPHVIRTAGSDSGRLWRHPQFKPLYDHVFRSASMILAGGTVARALVGIGVPHDRLRPAAGFRVDEQAFSSDGPALDVPELLELARADPRFAGLCYGEMHDDLAYLGVYGKLGERKGTAALFKAVARAKARGLPIGLLVMGHARPRSGEDYRALAEELDVSAEYVQIPFLPNWRVPAFIRRCLAVCCLEQGFPIAHHAPIVAREVMASGACLVASTEMLRKLPFAGRVVHGYNCVAVTDVEDVEELADKIAAIVDRPEAVPEVGARARAAVRDWQSGLTFPEDLERALSEAAALGRMPAASRTTSEVREPRPLTVRARLGTETEPTVPADDPLFRLSTRDWALASDRVRCLVPEPFSEIRVLSAGAHMPDGPIQPRGSAMAGNDGSGSAVIDKLATAVVSLSDGRRTVAEIAAAIWPDGKADAAAVNAVGARVLHLFELGALKLAERDGPVHEPF